MALTIIYSLIILFFVLITIFFWTFAVIEPPATILATMLTVFTLILSSSLYFGAPVKGGISYEVRKIEHSSIIGDTLYILDETGKTWEFSTYKEVVSLEDSDTIKIRIDTKYSMAAKECGKFETVVIK